jgi:hypothetical protein
MGGDSLFMLITQDPTPPENAELSAKKIGSASPHTHGTHLVSHHPTSFSSNISNLICSESFFQYLKLFAAIHNMVGAIPRQTLEDMFRLWLERIEWISQNNDNYYP